MQEHCGAERRQSGRTTVETVDKRMYVKYKALKKEIGEMLLVLGGNWILEESVVLYPTVKVAAIIAVDYTRVLVSGKGSTKTKALEKLLKNWQEGQSEPYVPAAGSLEELRLKLAVREG